MLFKSRLAKIVAAVASAIFFLWEVPSVGRTVGRVFAIITGFDFFYERSKDPSWLGGTFDMALNPPPGTALLVAIVGLVLIYWSTKPRETRMSLPVLGMLVSVVSLAGFGGWYLVRNQSPQSDSEKTETVPIPSDLSRPSMLSGRKISGLEVVSRLERLEKEHAATVSELAATKEQLETKKQELAAANPTTTVTVNATKIPAPKYNRAQIGHIIEAINDFYPIILDIEKASDYGVGITGSMEAIIRDNGAAVYLSRMDELRLKLNDAFDRLRKAKEEYGLYQEACNIVADSNLFSDPFYASWNELAGILREIPENLNARSLSIFVGAKKETFSTRVSELHEWAKRKKQALIEYRQFYLQRPTTD